jgi:hypothetical protein
MIIKTLDEVVNAVPDCTSVIASKLIVGTPRENTETEQHRIITDAIISRLLGYSFGVGVQAVTLGCLAGYKTNSALVGVVSGVSSAATALAVKAMKYI